VTLFYRIPWIISIFSSNLSFYPESPSFGDRNLISSISSPRPVATSSVRGGMPLQDLVKAKILTMAPVSSPASGPGIRAPQSSAKQCQDRAR